MKHYLIIPELQKVEIIWTQLPKIIKDRMKDQIRMKNNIRYSFDSRH